MFGAMSFSTLFGASVVMCDVAKCVWMFFMFCLIVSVVVSSGSVSRLCV